jgi:hypothetical protein
MLSCKFSYVSATPSLSCIYDDVRQLLYCIIVLYNPHGLCDTTVWYNNLCRSSHIPGDGPVWPKHVAEFT